MPYHQAINVSGCGNCFSKHWLILIITIVVDPSQAVVERISVRSQAVIERISPSVSQAVIERISPSVSQLNYSFCTGDFSGSFLRHSYNNNWLNNGV